MEVEVFCFIWQGQNINPIVNKVVFHETDFKKSFAKCCEFLGHHIEFLGHHIVFLDICVCQICICLYVRPKLRSYAYEFIHST